MPNPLARPRTNPFETKVRRAGEARSRELSVQCSVHGKITSSTPNVAQTVTNSRARTLSSHLCARLGALATSEVVAPPRRRSDLSSCASSKLGTVDAVFGSAVREASRNTAHECRAWDPSAYFTSLGP